MVNSTTGSGGGNNGRSGDGLSQLAAQQPSVQRPVVSRQMGRPTRPQPVVTKIAKCWISVSGAETLLLVKSAVKLGTV
jgi:hypothetical protein